MDLAQRLRLCTKAADVAGDRAAVGIITEAADLLEEALKALELFARLEIPARAEGNAGFYSIPFKRIEAALAILTKSQGEKIDG